jgi:superfamily II DNA/RNA helicase
LTFTDFNFHPSVLEGIRSMGFEKPTEIQEKAIPYILQNKDLISCAQTGTGKTAAYLLPVLHKIVSNPTNKISTLILAPTRELALQIDQQVDGFAYFVPISSISIYGGSDGAVWEQQKQSLINGADIIIATPGRLMSHATFDYLDLSHIQYLILDEADKMLDMGFYNDIMYICSLLPKERQTLLFSATMPPRIAELAKKILIDPEHIYFSLSKPPESILQAAYLIADDQKNRLIVSLLKGKEMSSILVFASTKIKVKNIVKEIHATGLSVNGIHSDLEQSEREKVMLDFRNRKFQILVATDIVSRGIDIEDIELIINYDVPHDPEDYVHRIGRTARAEASGVAITFINKLDVNRFKLIEKHLESVIYKVPLPPDFEKGTEYKGESSRGNGSKHKSGSKNNNKGNKNQRNRKNQSYNKSSRKGSDNKKTSEKTQSKGSSNSKS